MRAYPVSKEIHFWDKGTMSTDDNLSLVLPLAQDRIVVDLPVCPC